MKLAKFLPKLLLAALLLTVSAPLVADKDADLGYHAQVTQQKQDTKKNARKNDPADHYLLKSDGRLYRFFTKGNSQFVTGNVQDLKVSQHPNDAAYLYFIRSGDLHIVNRNGDFRLQSGIKKIKGKFKYNVVPSIETTIVNVALTRADKFSAWDDSKVVFSQNGIRDYRINPNFGTSKPFSSYVAFLIDHAGHVTKVKGKKPNDSKVDRSRTYKDVQEFMKVNNI